MSLDAATARELIQKLNTDREAYIDSVNKTHQLLIQAISAASSNGQSNHGVHGPSIEDHHPTLDSFTTLPPRYRLTTEALMRKTAASSEIESLRRDYKTSVFSEDDDDDGSSMLDDSESLFVKTPLQPVTYTEEGLKEHILQHQWTFPGRQILQDVFDPSTRHQYLHRKSLFPTDLGEQPDRSHLSHYSIFDVGEDGAPLPILDPTSQGEVSRSVAIWNRIKSINDDPARQRKAVGRITIVREPSPLLYAALHYTHNKYFNMDELFSMLVDDDPALMRSPDAFSDDHRMQRSFSITFEYFTIIGPGCEPMPWQRADPRRGVARTHIPISRCSSVVALSLEGLPMGHVRNKQRRATRKIGDVFDPFSPWRVLSITAYPDERSSLDAHDTTKHYVNGPEAFLVTLRAEFRDAARRLTAVYEKITDMVEPPADFIFNLDTRDKLLFEDDKFTYSRRYFWAFQTLGIMNEDIRDMVQAYQNTFKNGVWEGTDKIIWPGSADIMASSKHTNWRRRMKTLRRDIEIEIARLKDIQTMNSERMRVIKGLHGNLFNGTSVLESRKSVQSAMITVQQGRNIKLLTLVTIFFLPLTFVTSVFGMTNMPQNGPMDHFAWATIAICIPTYILIGSLNTSSGMEWWTQKTSSFFSGFGHATAKFLDLFHYRPSWTMDYHNRFLNTDSSDEEEIFGWTKQSNRVRHQQPEVVPRGTFHGMPLLSPQHTYVGNGDSGHNLTPMSMPADKERHPGRQHRDSNPPTPLVGAVPPHRPSIGIVPLPEQVIPPAYSKQTEDAGIDATLDYHGLEKKHDVADAISKSKAESIGPTEKLTDHITAIAEEGNKSDSDTVSKSSQNSLPSSRRRGMFAKVFRSGGSATSSSIGEQSRSSHGKIPRSHSHPV